MANVKVLNKHGKTNPIPRPVDNTMLDEFKELRVHEQFKHFKAPTAQSNQAINSKFGTLVRRGPNGGSFQPTGGEAGHSSGNPSVAP